MTRCLFISEYYDEPNQGAYETTQTIYHALISLMDKNNVDVVSIRSRDATATSEENVFFFAGFANKRDRVKNVLHGYPFYYNRSIEDGILHIIQQGKYDLIWINNSQLGRTVRKLKRRFPQLPIILFYHGICADSMRQELRVRWYNPGVFIKRLVYMYNESLAAQYADKRVLLNQREGNMLQKYYHRCADAYLPVCYLDKAIIEDIKQGEEFRILFVGGYFWPNIFGITWFAENVMPYVEKMVRLYIVGRKMELLKEQTVFQRENIEVIGGVEDLSKWYNSSDLVIGPIFHGNGMKTKTAEAMMYGKRFIGTKEALCGYEDMEDCHCESAEEFIQRINQLVRERGPRFDAEMRKRYEEHYSLKAAEEVISSLLADWYTET